jgi:hypothetical protein
MKPAFLLAIVLVLAAPPASPQGGQYSLYGDPVEVTISDLITGGMFYTGRAIRTRGRLEVAGARSRAYQLSDAFNYKLPIYAVPEVASEFESEARFRLGQDFIITGVMEELPAQPASGTAAPYVIRFWRFDLPPDRSKERLAKAQSVSVAELVARPGHWDGRLIRVVGAFRGRNLFTDLPARTQRNRSDWVLQDEDQAVWVTGKKPKGTGWELDPELKRDTGKWIEVLGVPQTRGATIYMRAESLSLATAPNRPVVAEQTPTPPPPPKAPPVVVFALPLDGEAEVTSDSRFVVQFNKDMDESSFKGRVELRYLGPDRPGVRPLDAVSFTYDPGRKALTVDPGDRLPRGAEVELRLLAGIKDVDGLELVARGGQVAEGAVDVLRYRVGT